MKLQKATQCAIFALLDLARQPDRQISAAEIAERHGISANHLAKVLRDLTRVGLVESVRGAGGGYRFSGNAKRVTLYEVIRLSEDIDEGVRRGEPSDETDVGQAVGQVMSEINEIAMATLKSITLATLLKLVDRNALASGPSAARPRAAAASSES